MTNEYVCEADVHKHVPSERAELFTTTGGGNTEIEYVTLLCTIIRCVKPYRVLETGTLYGSTLLYLIRSMMANNPSDDWYIVSLEHDPGMAAAATDMLDNRGPAGWRDCTEIICTDSVSWLKTTSHEFEFVFFDTNLAIRCMELEACLERGLLRSGSMFAIHDTSIVRTDIGGNPDPESKVFRDAFTALHDKWDFSYIEFPLSRGMIVGQV